MCFWMQFLSCTWGVWPSESTKVVGERVELLSDFGTFGMCLFYKFSLHAVLDENVGKVYLQWFVSPLFLPSTQINVSGVIPNELLEKELTHFGKFASGFRTVCFHCKDVRLLRIQSLMRQVFIYLNACFPDSGGIFQSQLLKCLFMKALPVWNVMYRMTLDTNAIRVCTKDFNTLKQTYEMKCKRGAVEKKIKVIARE